MESGKRYTAEEVLSAEELQARILKGDLDDSQEIDEKELRLAKKILSFFKKEKNALAHWEKEYLKRDIKDSIKIIDRKKSLRRIWTAAASFLIIISGISIVYPKIQFDSNFNISAISESLKEIAVTEDIRLILQSGKEVLISNNNSEIEYDEAGDDIIIDSNRRVEQEINTLELTHNTMVVPYGKRSVLTMADGTKVWLNSGSKLVYPVTFDGKTRDVYLEGEAFFDVAHKDRQPFNVSTKDFKIRVLGTIFNVSAYSDDKTSSAVLASGKIELQYASKSLLGKSKIEMSPEIMVTYDPESKEIIEKKVSVSQYTSWKDGFFILEKARMDEIIKKLSRYYNVDIILSDGEIANETFSGYLDLKKTALQVLEVINQTDMYTISIEGERIILNSI